MCVCICIYCTCGGQPSMMTPTPLQCDSPNVVTRNRRPKELPVARVVTVVARDVQRIREGSRGFERVRGARSRASGRARSEATTRFERTRRGANVTRENGFRRRSPYLRWWGRPPRAVGSAGCGAPSLARGERSKRASRSTSTRRRRGRTSEIRGARTGSAAGDDARGARCRANRGGAVALARAEARGNGTGSDDGRCDDHNRRDWDVRVTREEDARRVSRHKWLAGLDRSRVSQRWDVDVEKTRARPRFFQTGSVLRAVSRLSASRREKRRVTQSDEHEQTEILTRHWCPKT